ncbi:MAG: hypothetical protein E3J72_18540 [Planctomycetota bacterium]|nr:MAG: hypothetical protein E3J72_18540 [Planctomycetota bacterium]
MKIFKIIHNYQAPPRPAPGAGRTGRCRNLRIIQAALVAVLVLFPFFTLAEENVLIVHSPSVGPGNNHYYRFYNGSSITAVQNSPGNPIFEARRLIARASPVNDEFLIGHLQGDSLPDLFLYNASGTYASNDYTELNGGTAIGTNMLPFRGAFDIAYEQHSGHGLIVYVEGQGLRYRTFIDGVLSAEQTLSGTIAESDTFNYRCWITLVSKPNSNEIALVYATSDINDYSSPRGVCVCIWDGLLWSPSLDKKLTNTVRTCDLRCFDACYEEGGDNDLVVAYGTTLGVRGFYLRSAVWSSELSIDPGSADRPDMLDMACKPGSDVISIAFVEDTGPGGLLGACRWNGGDTFVDGADLDLNCEDPNFINGSMTVATGWFDNGSGYQPIITYCDTGSANIDWFKSGDEGQTWVMQTDWSAGKPATQGNGYTQFLYPMQNGHLLYTVQDGDVTPDITLWEYDGAAWTNVMGGTNLLEGSADDAEGWCSAVAVRLPTGLKTLQDFSCTDCSSTTLTWAWSDIAGEDYYHIYDNTTDTAVVSDIAANSTYTVETGLSPNMTYIRYIKAYVFESGFDNNGARTSGYVAGTAKTANANMITNGFGSAFRGYCMFNIGNVPPGSTVTGVKYYFYCHDEAPGGTSLLDIRKVTSDPYTASGITIRDEIDAGTAFFQDSPTHRSTGYKVLTLNSAAHSWVESGASDGWCALGMKEVGNIVDDIAAYRQYNYVTVGMRPYLEVAWGKKTYSEKSNVVEVCTAANIPFMDNTAATFTFENNDTITVLVGDGGNPVGTTIELEYAKGDANGPTEAFNPLGTLTGGYIWDVTSLEISTSYWFRARARNWRGCWTNYCDVTVWSTLTDAPLNFRCTGCSSTTLTWAWDDTDNEEGYDIFDNTTDTVVVSNIGANETTTTETGLDPNTTYTRYIKAYTLATGLTENCAATTTGMANDVGGKWVDFQIRASSTFRGYVRFGLENVSDTWTVTGVKLYVNCDYAQPTAGALMDIRELTSDPAGANGSTIYSEAGSGTIFVDDSIEHRTTGSKVLTMNGASHSWVESCVSQGWCAAGFVEEVALVDMAEFEPFNCATVEERPWLEVEYDERSYSAPSNVVETCTAAAIPSMDNTVATFTGETNSSITAQVDRGSNPNGTSIELEYAKGDANGPTEAFTSAGTQDSGYSWNVIGLGVNTSYWFQARAQSYAGIWTGYCPITVWSTDIGAPAAFTCIDCSTATLTWAWNALGGDGFEIFDNDTGAVVVPGIAFDATYTIETGLSLNKTYSRYIKAFKSFGTGLENCSATQSGYTTTGGKNTNSFINIVDGQHGFCKFDLQNLQDCCSVTGVTLYGYCYNAASAPGLLDIRRCDEDPDSANAGTLFGSIDGGVVFVDDSIDPRTIGYKVFTLSASSHGWVENCISQDWCALGFVEDSGAPGDTRFRAWDYVPAEEQLVLEVSYDLKFYTAPSNVVVTCTAAAIPFMDNTASTFNSQTEDTIDVTVGSNSNPNGTTIELWRAKGDADGPTESWVWVGTETSGYSWSAIGLETDTTYWFQAKAQNWAGLWTDCCSITVWSTVSGPPTGLACTGCTSSTLTWSWAPHGGEGLDIIDNDSGSAMVSDIPPSANNTIETGLSPNTTYRRCIKAFSSVPLIYYYADNQTDTINTLGWQNACTLTLPTPQAGDYLVMATVQVKDQGAEARLIRDSAEVHYSNVQNFGWNWWSFMSMEVLTADGVSAYTYALQVDPANDRATNAAIIAIPFPTGNYNFVNNSSEISASSTEKTHTTLTVTPPSGPGSDYALFYTAVHRTTNSAYQSRARFSTTNPDISSLSWRYYGQSASERFIHAGFWPLIGISANQDAGLYISASSGGTCYMCRSNIAAFRLSDSTWAGYACSTYAGEMTTTSTTPQSLLSTTFTPSVGQDYLLFASCRIGAAVEDEYVEVWWELDGSGYDFTEYRPRDPEDVTDRMTFCGMRRMNLTAAAHTFGISFRSAAGGNLVYASNASVLALPLEGDTKSYSDPSNVVEVCTAAEVPFMDNSGATFTGSTNSSITATVGPGANPVDTALELWYAKGNAGGPTEGFSSAGTKTSGYSWDVTGLDANTSYWFKARAYNWAGSFTGYCDVTVGSTAPGGPVNFRCTDCSSTTLTWAWDSNGGDGFEIFNNDTDAVVIPGIASGAVTTIETGLSPNTTYARYIKAFSNTPLVYYYADNLPEVSTNSSTVWANACTMDLDTPAAGDYLIMAAMQGASGMSTGGDRGQFRFFRDGTTELGFSEHWTRNRFHSFMFSEVLTASGAASYKYQLQLKNADTGSYDTRAQNSAIIAIKLPTNNYNHIDNLTEGTTSTAAWEKHSGITVTPPGSGDDYWIIHTSNFNYPDYRHYGGESRLYRTTATARELTFGKREAYESGFTNEWFIQGGFGTLKGISSNIVLEDQTKRGSDDPTKKKNVHIAAVRLSDSAWSGYADNSYDGQQGTVSTTGVTAVTRTFTVSTAQQYLIMASCGLGATEGSSYRVTGWLEHECASGTTAYDTMEYAWAYSDFDRATFAAIRRLYLETGSHTIRIMFKMNSVVQPGWAAYPTVIAVPLEGVGKNYTGPSNAVEACTAALVPTMDNTVSTFTGQSQTFIDVQVGDGGNPFATEIELLYAAGTPAGPTAAFQSAGIQSLGYSWNVLGLTSDTSYWFMSRALNRHGSYTGNCAITAWSTQTETFLSPSDFGVTACTSSSITWEWTDRSPDEEGFQILDDLAETVVIDDIATNSTSVTEGSLSENVQYTRKVRAFKDGKATLSSNSSSVSAYTLCEPPADGELSISDVTASSMKVRVDTCPSPTGDLTGAQFNEMLGNPGAVDSGWVTDMETGDFVYTNNGLDANTLYSWRARYRNGDGVPTAYNPLALTRYTLVPDPSVDYLNLSTLDASQVNGTVTAPPNPAAGQTGCIFDYVTTGGNSGWLTGTYSFSQGGLSPNSTYSYRVQLRNAEDVPTAWSGQKSIVTLGTIPGAPQFTTITTSSVTISWADNGNPGWTAFRLEQYPPGGPWAFRGSFSTTMTSDFGLAAGTTYKYRVCTINLEGNPSAWSVENSFETLPPSPTGPVVSIITAPVLVYGNTAWPTLSFNCDQDTNYLVEQGGDGTPGSGDQLPYMGSITGGAQEDIVFARDDLEPDNVGLPIYVICYQVGNVANFGFDDCIVYDDHLAPTTAVTYPADNQLLVTVDTISGTAAEAGGGNVGIVELVLHDLTDGDYYDNATGGFTSATPVFFAVSNASVNWSFNSSGISFVNTYSYVVYGRSTDSVGNIGPVSDNVTFIIDETIPDITIESPAAGPATIIGPAIGASMRWRVDVDCEYFLRVGGNGSIASGFDAGGGLVSANSSVTSIVPATRFPDDTSERFYVIARSLNLVTAFEFHEFYDDETVPNTTLTTAIAGQMTPPQLIEGTSSDDTAGLAKVEIAVRDINDFYYSPPDGLFIPCPVYVTVTGLTSWQYDIADVPFANKMTYIVSVRVIDLVGNIEQRDIATFDAVVPPKGTFIKKKKGGCGLVKTDGNNYREIFGFIIPFFLLLSILMLWRKPGKIGIPAAK